MAGRPRTDVGTSGDIATIPETKDATTGKWRKCQSSEKPQRYRAYARHRDADGVTRMVTKFGATEAAAKRELKNAIKARGEVVATTGSAYRADMTVKAACERWLNDAMTKVRPAGQIETPGTYAADSIVAYRSAISNHLAGDTSSIANLTLREANVPSVLKAWLQGVANTSGSGAAHHAKTVLSLVLKAAVLDGALSKNSIRDIGKVVSQKAPTSVREAGRALTRAEFTALLDAAESSERFTHLEWPDLLRFMVATGVRRGEALAVQWDIEPCPNRCGQMNGIDLDAGTMHIPGTKRERSDRTIFILPEVRDLLLKRRAKAMEAAVEPHGYLFPPTGKIDHKTRPSPQFKRDDRNLARQFEQLRDAAGIPWATIHTLRTTCGTWLVNRGVTPDVGAAYLGDSVPTFIANYVDSRSKPATMAEQMQGFTLAS